MKAGQRIRPRTSGLWVIGYLLVALLGAALIFYGLMTILLALKVSPAFVDSISGYSGAYDYLAGLEPQDVTDTVRIIVAAAGLLAFLLFGYLAWKSIPRPYLSRSELTLSASEDGGVVVGARAVERLAEASAERHRSVASASALFIADDIVLNVSLARVPDAAQTLRDVQSDVREALDRHQLPERPVNVTLTAFDHKQRRELN